MSVSSSPGSQWKPNTIYPELVHPALISDLFQLDVQALAQSPLQTQANQNARAMDIDVQALTHELTHSCKICSPSNKHSVLKVLSRGANHIRQFGVIPYSYKQMGVSPRLLPVSYGKSINHCKRALRHQAYEQLGHFFRQKGFVLLDLDLTSGYTSILWGLFPQDLEAIQRAIEAPGMTVEVHPVRIHTEWSGRF